MNKNWIFVILSIALLFSLGFMPAPGNEIPDTSFVKATETIQVVLSVTNTTQTAALVRLYGEQAYFRNFGVPKGSKITRKIDLKPGSFAVVVSFNADDCASTIKTIKITPTTKKISLSLTCGKVK